MSTKRSRSKSSSAPAGKSTRTLRKDIDEMPAAFQDRPIPVSSSKTAPKASTPLPTWYKVLMFGLMVVGLLWVVAFYIMQANGPVAAWGQGNIAAGFGLILVGFIMMMRWR
ncbi:cell division protein CrgA [Falsarthrobacter nasiphocae]|uniref:Cell division protein CrgA n=1 Tax=Falsarthrobacter nasiphocae TaxID=189863 RepID=A0AAE3YHD8_9MICC|nr:cell division protein CrgA [Falsarthrobacter nasiphocae]MDR6892046.1 hypothetical protein [Falsarthrobacter nasiphocae]